LKAWLKYQPSNPNNTSNSNSYDTHRQYGFLSMDLKVYERDELWVLIRGIKYEDCWEMYYESGEDIDSNEGVRRLTSRLCHSAIIW
jgi:hypothetical protein